MKRAFWSIALVTSAFWGSLLPAVGADVIISEFLASNVSGITDEDGDDSDWIELSNISESPVDLAGWHLTDRSDELDQWTFPSLILNVGEEVVIFASGKNRALAGQELHTNFKLGTSGEYLALVRPDGVTVENDFAPAYPQQYPDVSYGIGTSGGTTVLLAGADAPLKYKVPADASEDVGSANAWNELTFNDSSWTSGNMGVGYATAASDPYDAFIGNNGDLQQVLYRENTTVYLRVPFQITNPAEVTALEFSARYDDGFGISINGSPFLATANDPTDGVWDFEARAGGSHSDSLAIALEAFAIDLNQVNLVAGRNVLTVHGLNRTPTNSDFLFDGELKALISSAGGQDEVYMASPTPGSENGAGVTNLGPVVRGVTENPPRPDLAQESTLLVTAKVTATENPVDRVDLFYRRGFLAESSLQMLDDGINGDVLAGDGVFSVQMPLAGLEAGEMIRWRVEARDGTGVVSKEPFFSDPLNSPEYFGTAAVDHAVVSDLPVLEWFIQNPSGANNRTGTRASVIYLGEFYDNIFCRVRGASSSGLAKKSYKFDFNTGHHMRIDDDPDSVRVEEFNLNTTWTDKAYVRQSLSYDVYDLAGSPGCVSFLTRVEQNGAFFSVAAFIEQVDQRLLRREKRMDDEGALYKMFNGVTSGTSGVEKKNRKHESNADLIALVNGINTSGVTLENYIFDHIDLPRQLNYMAATVLTQNNDNMKKNFYLYRDTEGSGEWTQLPWDTDLTWGSHYMTNDSISHDGIWATADWILGGRSSNARLSPSHPFVGAQEYLGNRSWNKMIDKLLENDRFKEMFRRRLRTLIDELMLTSVIDDRIDAMELALGNDAVLDKNKWGQFGQQQTLAEALGILQNDYLVPRRTHLAVTHLASNSRSYPFGPATSALLPDAQVMSPQLNFGDYEASPESGNQDEEFIEIQNTNNLAIDLTGWKLEGGVDFEFLPGTIIEANRSLFVSPEVATFRARSESPTGGEGLNVEGGYEGQISARGEMISLIDPGDSVAAVLTTSSDPSDQQNALRITEIFFAPTGGKEFEFIEVRNVGGTVLDLAGVSFSDGVEAILSGTLAPGEYGLVVSNPVNFPGQNIVGTYTGALNNGGEQLTLRDSVGENILSFDYEGDWFLPAQNLGYSLEIRDDSVSWQTWDERSSWAISSDLGGSPGTADPGNWGQDYRSWSEEHFSVAQLADPLISGPAADASGDGMTNLLSYALGLNPNHDNYDALPVVSTTGNEVQLSFSRASKTVDLEMVVEVSHDLQNWDPTASQISVTANPSGGEDVVYRSNFNGSDQARQFMRVRVKFK
ncbi:MAG: CotH kinase family protein [Akkermansiaceae bacterium]